MSRRLLLALFFLACTFCVVASGNAQTAARPATIARPAAPAADLGWLGAPDHSEPSPLITSLKGVGTANAVAEARMTQKVLTEYCAAHAGEYPSVAGCLKQKQGEYANKVFRASADCTAGRITTSGNESFTLDGLWEKGSDGSGRTRWTNAEGNVVTADLIINGLHISQQWETLCPGPVTPALIARARNATSAAPAAAAAQRPPSVCPPGGVCDEVPSFAAAITDFKASRTTSPPRP